VGLNLLNILGNEKNNQKQGGEKYSKPESSRWPVISCWYTGMDGAG